MKKVLSVITFAVFFYISGFAQQALFGGQDITSPEIRSDNTVTFRLFAPQANKVEITGDFLPTKKTETPYSNYEAPGIAELTKNAQGVWEFTTPQALPSELYSYSFIVA